MASDYVDDLLRAERESFKRKEAAAKKFDNRLDNFRKSAKALRDAARQLEKAFPGMSRTAIADKWAMTGTEKNVAFDAKGELVATPAGKKPASIEPAEPENEDAPEQTPTEPGMPSGDDGAALQDEPAADVQASADEQSVVPDQQRPSWMTD